MIAGIALAHRAALPTGNTAPFDDLSVALTNLWAPRVCELEHRSKEPQT